MAKLKLCDDLTPAATEQKSHREISQWAVGVHRCNQRTVELTDKAFDNDILLLD